MDYIFLKETNVGIRIENVGNMSITGVLRILCDIADENVHQPLPFGHYVHRYFIKTHF